MTYREIFNSAIALIAEEVGDGAISDYEERAAYILAVFCNQTARIDRQYRQANALSAGTYPDLGYISLDSSFILHPVFAPVAAYYLGSALTVDENEAMSERLFEQYTDAITSIVSALPLSGAPISDAYGLI